MAVTTKVYSLAPSSAWSKKIDWLNDTIKVALLTSSYTPNQNTHQYFSDVSANEVSGTGYTAGGVTLGSKTAVQSTVTMTFSGANASWSASTITARYAVIYDSTPGTGATDPLVAYVDFGADQSSSSGTFTISWSGSGIFTTTVS